MKRWGRALEVIVGPLAGLLFWAASAMVGVVALWAAVLDSDDLIDGEPGLRWLVVVGLVLGLVAASRWLYMMASGRETYDQRTWALWILMLAGPILVGLRRLLMLITGRRSA